MGKKKDGPVSSTQFNHDFLNKRGCRDIICCLLFIIFQGFMIWLAFEGFTKGDIWRLTSTFDSEGNACGVDKAKDYKFAYFSNPHGDFFNKTICVKNCPTYSTTYRPRTLDGYKTNSTIQFNNLWTDDPNVQFQQVLVIPPNNKVERTVNNPADNFAKWYLLYYATRNQRNNATFGVYHSFSNNWNDGFPTHMPIVYKTTTFLDRMCIPDVQAIQEMEVVQGLMDAFNVQLIVSTANEWINDTMSAWEVILMSVGVAFILGMIYMGLVYFFSGIIVWLVILLYFVILAAIAYFAHWKSEQIQNAMDYNEKQGVPRESGQNTENMHKAFLYLSYALTLAWVISFIIFCCSLNTIRRAIAIVKTACLAVKDMPLMMLIPIIFTILIFIHLIWWMFSFGYVLSTGTIKKSPTGPWANVAYESDRQRYYNWGYVFGGLWNNAFIGALNEFILASCVVIWYFSGGGTSKKNLHKPISRSIYRAWRFHLGSLAFGSLILAIVQFIRILLLYYQKQLEALGGNKNRFTRCMLKYAHCCMACLEKIIAFITRQAYIMIAVEGKSFIWAAKDAFRLIMENPGLVAILNGIGAVFRFIGKFFIALGSVYFAFYLMSEYSPWKHRVGNILLPLIIVFIITFIIGILFMSVYGMAIDTILLCFLKSKEINKHNPNQAILVPGKLQTFLDNEKLREEQKAEKMIAKVKH